MKTRKKPTVQLITLGCAKNLVDSEMLLGKFSAAGYPLIYDRDDPAAEVVIINTCGFIGDARQESVDMILRHAAARKAGRVEHLFVMGCLSERYKQELQRVIPEVEAFFGVSGQEQILRLLEPDLKKELPGERLLTTPKHFAWLKISEGCNRRCSFCAIPGIRGKQVSVPMDDILAEAVRLRGLGVKEVNVIAQDTTQYGLDLYGRKALPGLLERLAAESGIPWIRLHYAYPKGFPVRVLKIMRQTENICNYIDIPFQHINTGILRSMRRGITREGTLDLLGRIREEVPGVAVRTTLIVGYPGEGKKEFRELLDFVAGQAFDRLGVFTYSPEEGTPAIRLADPVPARVKEERLEAVMTLQMEISARKNREKTGKVLTVLIDREEDGRYIGRTAQDSPEVDHEVIVSPAGMTLGVGDFCRVRITGSGAYDLYAEPLAGPE